MELDQLISKHFCPKRVKQCLRTQTWRTDLKLELLTVICSKLNNIQRIIRTIDAEMMAIAETEVQEDIWDNYELIPELPEGIERPLFPNYEVEPTITSIE
ncbi:Hypothetical_protein [Hexamita inflata]|uniref:Hypothetical_protein n=1 Tax=Hexamita inflata TaxID=28002 RepID=A0AA86QIV3_9EUKA|nr:Hypothetical protein HINF_LOCUS47180 [Hexamita inflata]